MSLTWHVKKGQRKPMAITEQTGSAKPQRTALRKLKHALHWVPEE
jgi:hypothetical protein